MTTFGIGSDFDEKIMKGIAECGHGDYFFIEDGPDIVNKVGKGMLVLQELIGTNLNLKVRGLNGGVVKRMLSYDDLVGGAQIGDICEDDLRQILIEVEVTPKDDKDNLLDVLSYVLTYSPTTTTDGSKEVVRMEGTLQVHFTTNETEVQQENSEVFVALTLAKVGEKNKTILNLIRSSQFDEAINMKESIIQDLKSVIDMDNTGVVSLLIERAISTLKGLKEQKDMAQVEKDVDFEGYQASIVHRKCF